MSELRRKMLTDLRIRNYAERTQEGYEPQKLDIT